MLYWTVSSFAYLGMGTALK